MTKSIFEKYWTTFMLMNIKGLNGEEHQRKAWILSEQPLYFLYFARKRGNVCNSLYGNTIYKGKTELV